MKTILACIGAAMLVLYTAASFGIGHLHFTYGPEKAECTKVAQSTQF